MIMTRRRDGTGPQKSKTIYSVLIYDKVILAQTRFKIIALIEYWGWKTTYWNNIELRKTHE